MLLTLIIMSLIVACPVLALLITLSLVTKYRYFVRSTGIDPKVIVFSDNQLKLWTSLQIGFLILSTLLAWWANLSRGWSLLLLIVYLVIAAGLAIKSWLEVNRKHHAVDVQALENDAAVDENTIRIFIGKRLLAFHSTAMLIMFVNISLLLIFI
ncbi:hypothetical protein ACYATM_02945 [Lactobacillaceae bacterium Scapto_B20]